MKRTETNEETEIDLLELVRVLWSKVLVIVLAALLAGLAAFAVTKVLVTPKYKAQTTMYVNNQDSSEHNKVSISQSDLNTSQQLVQTYTVFLQSRSTLDEVILQAKLPYDYETLKKMVTAHSVNDTEAFSVEVVSTNPQEAALIANTIGAVLPEKISNFITGSSVKIVDYAVVPDRPSSPNVFKNTILGMILGILVSGAVIVIRYLLDVQIHGSEYLTQNFDIPVLAVIPDLISSRKSDSGYYGEAPQETKHTAKGGKTHG